MALKLCISCYQVGNVFFRHCSGCANSFRFCASRRVRWPRMLAISTTGARHTTIRAWGLVFTRCAPVGPLWQLKKAEKAQVNKRNVNPDHAYDPNTLNFTHGVASGDPYPDSVILWTRCSPMQDDVNDNSTVTGPKPLYNPVPIYRSDGRHLNVSMAPVCLQYKIATDQALNSVADSGMVRSFCSHAAILASRLTSRYRFTPVVTLITLLRSRRISSKWEPLPLGLMRVLTGCMKPFTYYYYQFNICNSDKTSPIGRTKTTPNPSDSVNEVKIAVYSCSNFREWPESLSRYSTLTAQRLDFSTLMAILPIKTVLTMLSTLETTSMSTRMVTMAGAKASGVFRCRTGKFTRCTTIASAMPRTGRTVVFFHLTPSSPGSLSGMTMRFA